MDRLLDQKEWEAMTWLRRIDFIMEKYGYKTIKEMSEKFFSGQVSEKSIRMWRSTTRSPNKEAAALMRGRCIRKEIPREEMHSACEALLLDAAVDAAEEVITDVLVRRDARQLYAVSQCIASKIAFQLQNALKGKIVCKMESVFGRYPAAVSVTITPLKANARSYATLVISHPENAASEFTVDMTLYKGGAKYSRTILAINDYSIARIVLVIQNFYNSYNK